MALKKLIKEPEKKYHANKKHVGSSRLKKYAKSAALFNVQDTMAESTSINGRAFHCYVLESHKFDEAYYYAPAEAHGTTKKAKAEKEQAVLDAQGRDVLWPTSDYLTREELALMRGSVHSHPVAGPLLSSGVAERVARRNHVNTETGNEVGLQARFDWIHNGNTVVDLKSCMSVEDVTRSVYKFDYLFQVGHYVYTAAEYFEQPPEWYFAFVEKKAPYRTAVLYIPPSVVLQQVRRVIDVADDLANSIAWDEWPTGYETALVWDSASGRAIQKQTEAVA